MTPTRPAPRTDRTPALYIRPPTSIILYAANRAALVRNSKAIFIALVLAHGGRFLGYQAGIAVAVDLVWVVVFAVYLLTVRPTGASRTIDRNVDVA